MIQQRSPCGAKKENYLVVSKIFFLPRSLGKLSNLTNIFKLVETTNKKNYEILRRRTVCQLQRGTIVWWHCCFKIMQMVDGGGFYMRAAGHVFDLLPNEVIWIAAHCDDVDILTMIFDNSLQMYQRIIVSWKTGTLRSKSMAQIRKGSLVKGPYKLNYCIRGFSNEHVLLPSSSLLCFCTLILSVSQPQQSNTPPKFHMTPPQKNISWKGRTFSYIFWIPSVSGSILNFRGVFVWPGFLRPYPLMICKRNQSWLMVRKLNGWLKLRYQMLGWCAITCYQPWCPLILINQLWYDLLSTILFSMSCSWLMWRISGANLSLFGFWAPFSTFAPKVQDPTIETNETDSGKGLEHVETGDSWVSWLVERPTKTSQYEFIIWFVIVCDVHYLRFFWNFYKIEEGSVNDCIC